MEQRVPPWSSLSMLLALCIHRGRAPRRPTPHRLVRGLFASKETVMDKEHIKGAADKAKGAVKDAAGKVMDDKKLQAEGKMDKAKGEAREALGDAKDALKHVRNEH
jgi:uncharacterized protein YjbJ (UPF0337 family)